MIGDTRSKRLLKYAKTKAKLSEFGTEIGDYPDFQGESSDLSFPGVRVISDFSNAIVNQETISEDLYRNMQAICDYYDAASNAVENKVWKSDYLLVAAATYYLVGNFGSTKALLTFARNDELPCASALALKTLFEITYNPVVNLEHVGEYAAYAAALDLLYKYLTANDLYEIPDVVSAFHRSWEFADSTGSPDEAFFAVVMSACATIALQNSSRQLLPKFSDIPVENWSEYLASNNALRVLWPAQRAIGEVGALKGDSAIIQMPTGVGKTKSLGLIIRARLLASSAARLIVVAPLRALCREIADSLRNDLSDIAYISELSDVLQYDIADDFREDQPTIAICTPEKLSYLIHHNKELLESSSFFAFDEAHLIDTASRGPAYELLLTEIKIACKSAQMIILSAVLPNSDDLSQWLFGRDDVTTDASRVPSTKKSIGIAEANGKLHYYERLIREGEAFFVPKSFDPIVLDKLSQRETKVRHFPELNDRQNINPERDLALYYALRLANSGRSAIYIPRRPGIRKLFERIHELSLRGISFESFRQLSNIESLGKLQRLFTEHYGANHPFAVALPFGVSPHYSGLPEGLRCSIEDEMTGGGLRCIACTATLAQGVNLPIKYLLVTGTQPGMGKTTARDFQNLVGRAARSGIYSEGSIILTDCRVATNRQKSVEFDAILDSENQEDCSSAILGVFKGFETWNWRITGNTIGEAIIENLYVRDWDTQIAEALLSAVDSLQEVQVLSEMRLRKTAVESIENYLCLMLEKSVEDEIGDMQEYIDGLCKETYAYHMADNQQRELLSNLFVAIGERLDDAETKRRIPLYTSSMLGIASTDQIVDWFETNARLLINSNPDELRDVLIGVYQNMFKPGATQQQETDFFKLVVEHWIAGMPYHEIVSLVGINDDGGNAISRVEKYCTEEVSYSLSRFVGSVREIALALDSDEMLVSRLFTLQQQLKYGLPTTQEQLVYRNLFNDRVIAAKTVSKLGVNGIRNVAGLREIAKIRSGEIQAVLEGYPDYFFKRLEYFINAND